MRLSEIKESAEVLFILSSTIEKVGSSYSFPEIKEAIALGVDELINELAAIRGGEEKINAKRHKPY